MGTERVLRRVNGFRRVVVATGHVTDPESRPSPRFPEHRVAAVRRRVDEILAELAMGPDDLLVCGGARGGDLIAAAAARACGATVWLLLAHPPDAFVTTSVAGGDPRWAEEFWTLVARTPAWVLPTTAERTDVYSATNEWMLATARRQAAGGVVTVIAVWDGRPAQGEGGTAGMVQLAGDGGDPVVVIDPMA